MKKCIATFCCLFFFILASFAQLIPDGIYFIRCASNLDYVVTPKGGKPSANNSIVITKWQNSNAQKWKVENQKDGSIIIHSMANSAYVIAHNGRDIKEYVGIVCSLSNNQENHQWVPEKQANGSFALKAIENKGFCLEISNAKIADNAPLQLYGFRRGEIQLFYFEPVDGSSKSSNTNTGGKNDSGKNIGVTKDAGSKNSGSNNNKETKSDDSPQNPSKPLIKDGIYWIQCAGDPTYEVTLENVKNPNGSSIVIHKRRPENGQGWRVENQKDGSIIISYNSYALSVKPQDVGEWGKVIGSKYSGKKSERWVPEKISEGVFLLKIQQNQNFCLDVLDYNYTNDNILQICTPHKGHNQQFKFVLVTRANDYPVLDKPEKTLNMPDSNPGISDLIDPPSSDDNSSNTGSNPTTSTSNPPASTSKQQIPNGVYVIKCAGDPNYVMTLKNSKATSGNEIVVHKRQNSNAQKWKVENQKDGSIIIRSMVNEKYAANVKSDEVGEWTKITSNLYGGKKNERWIPEKTAKGTFHLRIQQDKNLCLDVLNYEYVDDNSMHLYSFHGDYNQQFIFELVKDSSSGTGTKSTEQPPFTFEVGEKGNTGKGTSGTNTSGTNSTKTGTNTNTNTKQIISDGVYYIKCAGDPNYVMTLKNSKATSGNEIVVHKRQNSNAQKWKVENQKDGSIIIRSMVNEKYVVHVKSDEVGEWTKITSNLYGGKKNERWIPEKTAKGTFHLRIQQDKNLCLDVLNYEYVDDNSMHLYSFHGDHNQQFIFELVKNSNPGTGTTSTEKPPFTFEVGEKGNTRKGTSGANTSGTNTTKTGTNTTNTKTGVTTKTNAKQVIPDGVYVIKCSGDPNYVLTLEDGKVNNGLVVYKWKNANYQKWKVENADDGSIIIRSLADNKYAMGVKPDEVFDHTRVVGLLYNKKKSERWVPQKNSKGYYFLKLLDNQEFYLDVLDFNYFDNNIVQACGYWGDHNQQFIFELVK